VVKLNSSASSRPRQFARSFTPHSGCRARNKAAPASGSSPNRCAACTTTRNNASRSMIADRFLAGSRRWDRIESGALDRLRTQGFMRTGAEPSRPPLSQLRASPSTKSTRWRHSRIGWTATWRQHASHALPARWLPSLTIDKHRQSGGRSRR